MNAELREQAESIIKFVSKLPLEEALIWIENNKTDDLEEYVCSCRNRFEELLY